MLSVEREEYIESLAHNAAHGAWTKHVEVQVQSKAFLAGTLNQNERRVIMLRLLELAVFDPDHEWEAPILTGQPTSFARKLYDELNNANA